MPAAKVTSLCSSQAPRDDRLKYKTSADTSPYSYVPAVRLYNSVLFSSSDALAAVARLLGSSLSADQACFAGGLLTALIGRRFLFACLAMMQQQSRMDTIVTTAPVDTSAIPLTSCTDVLCQDCSVSPALRHTSASTGCPYMLAQLQKAAQNLRATCTHGLLSNVAAVLSCDSCERLSTWR